MDFKINDHRDSKEHGVTLFKGDDFNKGRILLKLSLASPKTGT